MNRVHPVDASARIQSELTGVQRIYQVLRRERFVSLSTGEIEKHFNDKTTLKKTFLFAFTLLRTIGRSHIEKLAKKLDKKIYTIIAALETVRAEMQVNLGKRFNPLDFPKTQKFVIEHCPVSSDTGNFVAGLEKFSLESFPFVQMAYLNPDADPNLIESVQGQRFQALRTIYRILGKKEGEAEENCPEAQKADLAKAYYTFGALLFEGKTFFFSEMIELWGRGSKEKQEAVQRLKEFIGFSQWVQPGDFGNNPFREVSTNCPFPEFLDACTLLCVERSLEIQPEPDLKESLRRSFASNETIRSNVIFFCAYPKLIRQYDWEKCSIKPNRLFFSFQIFFHTVDQYAIREQIDEDKILKQADLSCLLEMILHRHYHWKAENLPAFIERDEASLESGPKTPESTKSFKSFFSMSPRISNGSCHESTSDRTPPSPIRASHSLSHSSARKISPPRSSLTPRSHSGGNDSSTSAATPKEAFLRGWHQFQHILELVEKKGKGALLRNEWTFPLFIFLISRLTGDTYFRLFDRLLLIPNFCPTVQMLYDFCLENEEIQFASLSFAGKYEEILILLNNAGKRITHGEDLFFKNPLDITSGDTQAHLYHASQVVPIFLEGMKAYPCVDHDALLPLLRLYILQPNPQVFTLLADHRALGIERVMPESLLELMKNLHLIPKELTPSHRNEEQERLRKLKERYQFSDVEVFLLYCEFIRLRKAGREDQIFTTSLLVETFERFTPAITQHQIFLLYKNHPEIEMSLIERLKALRIEIFNAKGAFVLPQELLERKKTYIKLITDKMPFLEGFSQTLYHGFFPDLAPLLDYFRINRINPEGTPSWPYPEQELFWGQCRPISEGKGIPLSVCLHWDLRGKFPTLFISFSDIRGRRAQSISIPLEVRIDQIAKNDERGPFFDYLSVVSQRVLTEHANKSEVESTASTMEVAMRRYSLAPELASYQLALEKSKGPKQEEIWKFMESVKVAYRSLYLALIGNFSLPLSGPYRAQNVAAEGSIFSCAQRGSLIPEAMAQVTPRMDVYTPDAKPEQLPQIQQIFQKPNRLATLPDVKLRLALEEGGVGEYGILYSIRTEEERKEGTDGDSLPPLEKEKGYYIILSTFLRAKVSRPLYYSQEILLDPAKFALYFDYHNLIFKASCYDHLIHCPKPASGSMTSRSTASKHEGERSPYEVKE